MRRDCSLVQLEDMLDRNLFIRISKSGIVNLMNVDSYKKGTINMSILFWRIYTFYLPIIVGALFLIPIKAKKVKKETN